MDTTPAVPIRSKSVVTGAGRMVATLIALGEYLGFDVFTEVEASEAAWVDVVWCDRRFSSAVPPGKKPRLRRAPVLPIAAFEVENKTGLNAKHIKGSVSNLNNAGAQMGVIVIGNESLLLLGKQPAQLAKLPVTLEKELLERAYRWVHAEAQPKGRIVLMSERELVEWANRAGLVLDQTAPFAEATTNNGIAIAQTSVEHCVAEDLELTLAIPRTRRPHQSNMATSFAR